MGQGPPLVRVLGWFTHLEYESQVPFWRAFAERLSDHYTLIRYDGRGTGLSDRDIEGITWEGSIRDLEAVIDATGLDKVAVFGISQGGPAAIDYAIAHPERATHLIIYGSFARSYMPEAQMSTFAALVRQGWGSDVPAHRQFFTGLFMPDNPSNDGLKTFNELQRVSAKPEVVASLFELSPAALSVQARLGEVTTPTLVMHRRGDAIVPFEEGRLIAAKIPGARFVSLEGNNHAIVEGETEVWDKMVTAIDDFVLEDAPNTPKAEASAFRTVLFTDLLATRK